MKEIFLYHGKLIERGYVNSREGILEQSQEFYINGSLVSRGYIKIVNGKVVMGHLEQHGNRIE
ncbi:hypothetical protein [Pyrococcus yayanosii]|uniref:Uncharacterized protein n=1 Tax=Pyrococcus yayanosii (strain CH1 / JCM 16557) TaxID=529709 RepID=F8AH62_PYRYC|nr:hypothetical protein [Pyrococcus yayanosii]AEH25292.1 hypothetical protein PYCH_16260 [Pyrococcus yayanosii CH1]